MKLVLLLFVTTAQAFQAPAVCNKRRQDVRVQGRTATPEIGPLMETECDEGTISTLIDELARRTAQVRGTATEVVPRGAGEAASDEAKTWLLRFVDVSKKADLGALETAVAASIEWRLGEGRAITDAAREAYAKAVEDGKWNNAPVLAAAPSSAKISPYFTPAKLLTLGNAAGDGLIYAIRAGQIDDKDLMSDVSADELTDFFLYAKAVNERVAHETALRTGRLSAVVTCNDLSGVDLFGDASFRNALSTASKKGDTIFPGLAAETILLNLPRVLQSLVNIFKPLFPPSVQKKLKFAQIPLDSTETFLDKSSPARAKFLSDVDDVLLGTA